MQAVDDGETTKIISTFYKHMADESRRPDHTRAAFVLNKTMKSVNILFEFFRSISVLGPIYYILVRLLAFHCSYILCIAAIKDYPLFHGSSEAQVQCDLRLSRRELPELDPGRYGSHGIPGMRRIVYFAP